MTIYAVSPPIEAITLNCYITKDDVEMCVGKTHIVFTELSSALGWIRLWYPTSPIKYLWLDL